MEDKTTKTSRRVSRWSVRMKLVSAVCGCVLVAAGAYAATNWVVGLNAGSSGQGQSATISNLSITAVASPRRPTFSTPAAPATWSSPSPTRTPTR